MIKNYLIASLRSLYKNKLYSLINILGLAISISSCLAIYSLVSKELSYDDFHDNGDRIYRILFDERPSGRPGARVLPRASPPTGPTLQANFGEIEEFVRFRYSDSDILSYRDKSFYEQGAFYVDSTLFKTFSFRLLHGDEATALKGRNSVLLSLDIAKKYFGEEDPIGKTIKLNNERLLKVTGVFDESISNSHLPLKIVFPFHAFEVPFGYPVDLDNWSWASFHTYVSIAENTSIEALEQKIAGFVKQTLPESISGRFTFTFESLNDIYFSPFQHDQLRSGNYGFVYSLIAIGLVLISLALLNYINLNTSMLINRSREMGLRKVLGASRKHIGLQFLIEVVMVMGMSSVLSVFFFEFALTDLLASNMSWTSAGFFTMIISIPLCLLASLVPAWASFQSNTLSSLKGELKGGKSGIYIRRGLLIGQFVITISLIVSTILIRKQMGFIQSRDLGFEQEQIIVLEASEPELRGKINLYKSALLSSPGVSEVSFSSSLLDGNHGNVPVFPDGYEHQEGYPMHIMAANAGWLELIEVEVLAGQLLSDKSPVDTSEIVINEAALEILQKDAQEAIGLKMRIGGLVEGRIVGVVKDFHYASLHSRILPLTIFQTRSGFEQIYVKASSGNYQQVIEGLRDKWQKTATGLPFSYSFLDERLNRLYEKDRQFEYFIQIFTYVALMLAVFGLYGLVAFSINLELKSFAIRKVLGASESNLYLNHVKHYFLLIIISAAISAPIVIFFMRDWLNEFAYRVPIGWSPFLMATAILSMVVLMTISWLLIKAISSNPVEVLQSE